ncbi:hypothetical protein K502DRAFT_323604 [Neoconidiobolus thromboides FSU 785]|nr:hypothetical protein K502DRAFT_323604 [Neoconidiobolus thromboides FSU 785]
MVLKRKEFKFDLNETDKQKIVSLLFDGNYFDLSLINKYFYPYSNEELTFNQVKQWLAWYLHVRDLNSLSNEMDMELNEYVELIQTKLDIKLSKEEDKLQRAPVFLALTEFSSKYKPILFYLTIMLFHTSMCIILMLSGFQRNSIKNSPITYWIYEPHENLSDNNSSNDEPPILFIHGVGTGVSLYMRQILKLRTDFHTRKIVLLELQAVTLIPTLQIPTVEDIMYALDSAFQLHEIEKCSIMAHSYGTIATSFILKHRPYYIQKMCLVDPACFTNWEPTFAVNFMFNQLDFFMNRVTQHLMAEDLFVGNTIGRYAILNQGIAFNQDLNVPTYVYLSKYDFLLNSNYIISHLTELRVKLNNSNINYYMLDLTHGAYLFSNYYLDYISENL